MWWNEVSDHVVTILVMIAIMIPMTAFLHRPGRSKHDRTPLDIPKERYAQDEIGRAEYEERRKVLET